MNILLLILSLIICPSLIGCGIVKTYMLIKSKIQKAGSPERESAFCRLSVYLPTGAIIILALAGAINLLAVFTNMTISKSGMIFGICVLILTLISTVCSVLITISSNTKIGGSSKIDNNSKINNSSKINGRSKISNSSKNSSPKNNSQIKSNHLGTKEKVLLVLSLFAAIAQIVIIAVGKNMTYYGDQTLETVVSFVSTDHIYSVDPLTGLQYLNDYPFRLALQCLPFFYSVLSRIFNITPIVLTWHIMPVFWLICGYCTIIRISDSIFKKASLKILMFLCFEFLLWCNDAAYGATGFNIFHAGYNSVVVLELLLVYWTLGTLFSHNTYATILAIAVEPLVASTRFGLGACFFITIVFIIISKIPVAKRLIASSDGRTGGEDGKA